MANVMQPADFNKMLVQALTDKTFQSDLATQGFKALDSRGFKHGVPPALQTQIEKMITTTGAGGKKTYHCGVCGVCGTCSLCGEINFGAGAAALWATFALSVGGVTAVG